MFRVSSKWKDLRNPPPPGSHGTTQQVHLTCLAKHEVQNRCAGIVNARSSLVYQDLKRERLPQASGEAYTAQSSGTREVEGEESLRQCG